MGMTRIRVLATAPLAVAFAVTGVAAPAHAITAAAEPSGLCRIFASGIPIRQFISTERTCVFNAAALTLTLGNVVTYTWYPVRIG